MAILPMLTLRRRRLFAASRYGGKRSRRLADGKVRRLRGSGNQSVQSARVLQNRPSRSTITARPFARITHG